MIDALVLVTAWGVHLIIYPVHICYCACLAESGRAFDQSMVDLHASWETLDRVECSRA